MKLQFDEIGYWSEIKHDIIKKYAGAYSSILTSRKFFHAYIDAFAGAGIHKSKTKGILVKGSPLNALDVSPPFDEFHFVDIDKAKISELKKATGDRPDVHIYEGDCNKILLEEVFPKVKYGDYKRGLCLLDPYGLDLRWRVIRTAGQMESIEIFLNFPVMDINMNVLWQNPEGVSKTHIERMNNYWGDDSWKTAAYTKLPNLFDLDWKQKQTNPNEKFQQFYRLLFVFRFPKTYC